MLDHLIHLVNLVGNWGYIVIFVVILLECQALLGLVMPGESLVLAAGFFAEQGAFHLGVAIVVIAGAAIVGDSIGYELGRQLGRSWLITHGERVGFHRDHLERVDRFFQRHGGKSVFASHFMHLMRAMMPFMAGSSRMPYGRFLLFNAGGCITWAVTFVTLGFFVGKSWRLLARWIGRTSEIAGGALLLAAVMIWLWRWLVRHEADLKKYGRAVADRPLIQTLRRRFARPVGFLVNRFSPEGYLGLHLTIGLLLLFIVSWLFGAISEDVLHGEPLTLTDKKIAEWFHERTTPGMIVFMKCITDLASPLWVAAVSAFTAVLLGAKRCWYRLLSLMLVVPGGVFVALLLKFAVHRRRPGFDHLVRLFEGYSFPSGHTMAATLLYGLLAVFVAATLKRWSWRILTVMGTIALVVSIGFSRMYLGVHYLSDVLGGATAGLAWLALCVTAVDTLRHYREEQKKFEARDRFNNTR